MEPKMAKLTPQQVAELMTARLRVRVMVELELPLAALALLVDEARRDAAATVTEGAEVAA